MQFVFQTKQLIFFTLHHLVDRNTRPTGYHVRDIFTIHFFLDHSGGTLHRMQFRLYFLDLFFLCLEFAVTDFGHFTVIAFTLGLIGFKLQVFDIYLILLDLVDLFFFAFPLGFLFLFFFLQVRDFLVQLFQFRLIIFTFDCFAFNFQLFDTTGNFIQRFRHRVYLQTQTSSSLIHQVDRLIRKETVCNITTRKLNGRDDSIIFDTYLMVILVLFLQTTKDGNSIQLIRFFHHHHLETTFQRFILFKVFLILIQSSCTDGTQFTTCQGRFQDIGGIHCAVAFTCSYQGMYFINEENDLTIRLRNFIDYGF